MMHTNSACPCIQWTGVFRLLRILVPGRLTESFRFGCNLPEFFVGELIHMLQLVYESAHRVSLEALDRKSVV